MSTDRRRYQKLAADAERQGWTVKRCKSGHMKWIPPTKGGSMVVTSCTPSDKRSIANDLAALRRSGLRIRTGR